MLSEIKSLISIGKRIELERIRLGLSSLDICTKLDIHPNTYRNYENGKRDMPVSKIVILDVLGFDTIYIITGEKSTNGDGRERAGVNKQTQPKLSLIEVAQNNTKNNDLLDAMKSIENTLQQAGAMAGVDYHYVDLAKLGMQVLQDKTTIN